MALTASSMAFFISSVGASPVSSTLRLKLVAFTWAALKSLFTRASTFHSMLSSST